MGISSVKHPLAFLRQARDDASSYIRANDIFVYIELDILGLAQK